MWRIPVSLHRLQAMVKRKSSPIPADLRNRLETARLELLALFRALDQLDLTAEEMPQQELHDLFELDADFAEALHVMDQPLVGLDTKAMVRDTLESLEQVALAREEFEDLLPARAHRKLAKIESVIRDGLTIQDAYHSIPGRDP